MIKATDSARARYNAIQRPGVITTPGYLRLEASLQGTQTNIRFNVLTNEGGSQTVNERRLNLVDNFAVTHLGIFVYKIGAASPTAAQMAAARLRTNDNALVFTAASESDNIHALYNGNLKVTINSTVYVEALDLMRFYRVGEAQKGVGPAVITTEDQWSAPNWGMSELTPGFELSGAGKNDISISLPAAVDTSGTSSVNYVVCYMRGFLLQNASRLNPNA